MRVPSLAALSAAAISAPLLAAAVVLPATAENPGAPPIAVDLLTPRSSFTDNVSIKVRVKLDGHHTQVVNLRDPSRLAVARITVQPGARFPLHRHPGPVIVTVVEGQLTYVDPGKCVERVYPAGTAFVDTGSDVHAAYGSSPQVTTLIATFLAVPETGPLTITQGVQPPTNCTESSTFSAPR